MIWKSILKTAAATTCFAALHSALASRQAKAAAESLLGQRQRSAFYRPFYLAQSAVSLAALAAYIWRLPDRDLYRVRGQMAWLMHSVQGAALGYAVHAAHQVGIPGMLGIASLSAWLGQQDVPAEPEAQGPAFDDQGSMRATGPFALSRHPLNLVPVVVFWMMPRMTVRLAAFNAVATVYLVLGSLHEEARLLAAHKDAYREYQESGVPFYLPRLPGCCGTSADSEDSNSS